MQGRRTALLAAGAAALLLAAGCGESGHDAPVESRSDTPKPVYNMPDEFPNLTAVCIRGHLVIETTGNDGRVALSVVQNDPSCRGLDGVAPRPVAR